MPARFDFRALLVPLSQNLVKHHGAFLGATWLLLCANRELTEKGLEGKEFSFSI
jgi:hypothetical protein